MDDKELINYFIELKKDKKRLKEFLVDSGIITKNGKFKKEYKQLSLI